MKNVIDDLDECDLGGVGSVEWAARYADCRAQKLGEAAMCDFSRANASRSTIFDTVVKFVIGRTFLKSDVGRPGFFSSGDTKPVFHTEANRLTSNNRFPM